MRLSDLFRDMDLSALGVTALLMFTGVFAAIALRTLLRSRRLDERLSRLPLEDSQENTP